MFDVLTARQSLKYLNFRPFKLPIEGMRFLGFSVLLQSGWVCCLSSLEIQVPALFVHLGGMWVDVSTPGQGFILPLELKSLCRYWRDVATTNMMRSNVVKHQLVES